jgi:hypothetical protein
MAETEEEKAARKKELSEAMADGFELFESRREERLAKEAAANKDGDKENKPDDNAGGKSWAERLLGF